MEWLLFYGQNGQALLGTNHMSDLILENTFKHWTQVSSSVMTNDPLWKIHNHPGETPNKIDSMSSDREYSKLHPLVHNFVYIQQTGNNYDLYGRKNITNIIWDTLLNLYHR